MRGNSNPSGPEKPSSPGPGMVVVTGPLNGGHWWRMA